MQRHHVSHEPHLSELMWLYQKHSVSNSQLPTGTNVHQSRVTKLPTCQQALATNKGKRQTTFQAHDIRHHIFLGFLLLLKIQHYVNSHQQSARYPNPHCHQQPLHKSAEGGMLGMPHTCTIKQIVRCHDQQSAAPQAVSSACRTHNVLEPATADQHSPNQHNTQPQTGQYFTQPDVLQPLPHDGQAPEYHKHGKHGLMAKPIAFHSLRPSCCSGHKLNEEPKATFTQP